METEGAGTKVKKGATVTLVVSTGPEQVAQVVVPDVTGTGAKAAKAVLGDAGLEVNVVEEPSSEVPAGDVVSTDPAAGTSVDQGATVTITVSTGPEQVEIPDVAGMALAAATAQLEALGFKVTSEQVDSDAPEGQVVETVGAGAAVAKGSTVTLRVSSGDDGSSDDEDDSGDADGSGDSDAASAADKTAAREE